VSKSELMMHEALTSKGLRSSVIDKALATFGRDPLKFGGLICYNFSKRVTLLSYDSNCEVNKTDRLILHLI
jgi:hypothetical protein